MVEIAISQKFSAPPERVFAAVTEHKRIEDWQKGIQVTLERPGIPSPNGLGAVRRIKQGPLAIREEVVRWEEPRAMDYRMISGAPLRDHLGEIRLAPAADGGTDVTYTIRFGLPLYLGGDFTARLVASQLARVVRTAYAKLAAELR